MPQPQRRGPLIPDMTCKVVDSGRIQLLDRIGHGGWGVVYRARDLSHNPPKLRAVKIILKPPRTSRRFMYLAREIDYHYRVTGHPNVVTVHRAFEDARFFYIVLDYCPGGDMWRAITDRAVFARNDGLTKHVLLQIIDAVQACHDKGIYHRDIKPNNILVSQDCTKVYLSDFGLSTQSRRSMSFGVGTLQYKSPEASGYRGTRVAFNTIRSDTWALGVTMINMLAGRMPWGEATRRDRAFMKHMRDPGYLRQILPISKEADSILQKIFCANEEDTITLPHLRQLVKDVRTFWMSEEEVARVGPSLRFVPKAYLFDDSDMSEEGEITLWVSALALSSRSKRVCAA
ncbi:hypothetical protein NM688_g3644 [Phlebia brevispora]|uniref:Uncharacterized protein n=1 Tax=Phlebia brevispora TaxID=194682 RepID=A0ACC1T4Z2_9APHY|nr:hypothetical protein NM688_g3644 [Phlebia brevispora]